MDPLAERDHHWRVRRLTDLLDSIRAALRTRLYKLRPLVREYERLQAAEARRRAADEQQTRRPAQTPRLPSAAGRYSAAAFAPTLKLASRP
jgi:hypothetical protein